MRVLARVGSKVSGKVVSGVVIDGGNTVCKSAAENRRGKRKEESSISIGQRGRRNERGCTYRGEKRRKKERGAVMNRSTYWNPGPKEQKHFIKEG